MHSLIRNEGKSLPIIVYYRLSEQEAKLRNNEFHLNPAYRNRLSQKSIDYYQVPEGYRAKDNLVGMSWQTRKGEDVFFYYCYSRTGFRKNQFLQILQIVSDQCLDLRLKLLLDCPVYQKHSLNSNICWSVNRLEI